MPSRIYPKDQIENIEIDLCQLEHMVLALQNEKGGAFPIFDRTHLPNDLIEGQAFHTQQGQFCVVIGNDLYCMPGPSRVGGIGPVLYSAQQATSTGWGDGESDIYKIMTNDGSGEETILGNSSYNVGSPIWSPKFDRIVYTEVGLRFTGAPSITTKLCTIDPDGSNRIVAYDTGLANPNIGGRAGFYNYCMSPDGEKIAIIMYQADESDPVPNFRVVYADGSGDCGGGGIVRAFGNPQWNEDSDVVYVSTGDAGIVAYTFDGEDSFVIYEPRDLDYFWISNDCERFASSWFGGPASSGPDPAAGNFTIINVDGTVEAAYLNGDCPWTNPEPPTEIFWAPDDSFLILSRQNTEVAPPYNDGIAVRTTPDLSEWVEFPQPSNISSRGVLNWTLATVSGHMKLLGSVFNESNNGIGAYQWNIDTGHPEGFLSFSPWTGGVGTIWQRYSLGGLATCTAFFGTQMWDT